MPRNVNAYGMPDLGPGPLLRHSRPDRAIRLARNEGEQVLRKVAALVFGAAICGGGMVVMILAGILAALITDPFYPFWAAFAPLGGAAALFTAWIAGRVPAWLYPNHPDRKLWTRIAWVVSLAISGFWGYGVADILTSPMHWQ